MSFQPRSRRRRRRRRRLRLGLGAAGLVACAIATGCSSSSDEPAAETTSTVTDSAGSNVYVALGDSYASMGSQTAVDTTDAELRFCRRSDDNYPSVLAEASDVASVIDSTCQGAVIDNLLDSRQIQTEDTDLDLPAQVAALDEVDADVVTVSIGGNDIGFGEIVLCAGSAMRSGQQSNCHSFLDAKVDHQLGVLNDRLDLVYREIAQRAPDARLVATGYMPLLATEDNCAELDAISPDDRLWMISVIRRLNLVVAEAAGRHGAEFALPNDVDSHTGCASQAQRWVDFDGEDTGSFPMHPTMAGQRAMAEEIASILDWQIPAP